jgi:hypothetical protein
MVLGVSITFRHHSMDTQGGPHSFPLHSLCSHMYVSITLFLRIISVSRRGLRQYVMFFSSHINTYIKVDPSHLVVRDGIRNKKNTLVGKHARGGEIPLQTLERFSAGTNFHVFYSLFTATVCTPCGGPAHLALGSFLTYLHARAGGVP